MNGRTNAAGGKGGGITPEMFGLTKMAVDTFTYTSKRMLRNQDFYHSLGKEPKLVLLIHDTAYTYASEPLEISFATTLTNYGVRVVYSTAAGVVDGENKISLYTINDSRFEVTESNSFHLKGTYNLITMA